MVSADYLCKRDMRIIQGLEGDLEARRKVVRMLIKRVLVYRSGYIEAVPRKAFREIEESFTELVQQKNRTFTSVRLSYFLDTASY